MGIISVIEAPQTGGEITETGGSVTRVFQVLCDDGLTDTVWSVLNYEHPNYPVVGEIFPPVGATPTPKELFNRARSRRMQSGCRFPLFIVEVPYRTDVGYHEITPLSEPPVISYDTITTNEPIDTDVLGNPIVMSNLEGLDPKLEVEHSYMIQNITKKVAYFDQPNWAQPYINTTNLEETTIDWVDSPNGDNSWERIAVLANVNMLRIKKISSRRIWVGPKTSPDYVYHEVTVQVEIRTDDEPGENGRAIRHLMRVRDEGYQEFTGFDSSGKPQFDLIKGSDGRVVRKPIALDGAGCVKAQDADSYWHLFKVYPTVDLKPLYQYLGVPQAT